MGLWERRAGRPRNIVLAVSIAIGCWQCAPALAANDVAGSLITFNNNGGWSWFEDERAIVDVAAGKILISSVANGAGTDGVNRNADVEIVSYDLASHDVARFTLADNFQADDHDSAAILRRPDGTYLVSYSKHGSDAFTHFRTTTNAGSIDNWGSDYTFTSAAGTTYSNLYYLPNENGGAGRLYDFTRNVNFDPNVLVSYDLGATWSYGGKLLTEGGSSDRPYVRYTSDGQRVQLITTNRHPRDFDNSIYAGYVQDGVLYNSNGVVVDSSVLDPNGVPPASLTPIFTAGSVWNGVAMHRAWTVDVATDAAGLPYAVFQARANDLDTDHRFFYGRFDGSTWNVHELAKAGAYLYASENDYTGLAALDPFNPNRLFISSKIDPRTQNSMPHYEIFEGDTTDGGAHWSWQPITFNSSVDNVRPIIPKWDAMNTALLWMRGSYSSYTSYDMDIVGLTAFGPLQAMIVGDLDRDGDVDLTDYSLYLSGLNTDLSNLSPDQAYAKGDLNGDLKNNFADFVLFRTAYDAANGAGAFAELSQVPEASGMALVAMGCFGSFFVRRFGRRRLTEFREASGYSNAT
jgi:hypothetical protein